MALITCPECGKKVSDLAKTCPDCGYPIAAMKPSGTVKIKLKGLAGKVRIFRPDTMEIVWQGGGGDVAVFEVTQETPIAIAWGFMKLTSKIPEGVKRTVRGGDKYAIQYVNGLISLVPVEVIDAD